MFGIYDFYNPHKYSAINTSPSEEKFLTKLTALPVEQRREFLLNAFKKLIDDNNHLLSDQLDLRLCAHILAAHIISDTSLEGESFYKTAGYLEELIPKIKERGFTQYHVRLEQAVEQLKGVREFDFQINETANAPEKIPSVIQNIINRILVLKPHESLLLPSGYNGSPGHAMLLEIIRDSKDQFIVRILNSGDGLEYHSTSIEQKITSQSYLEINGISSREITNPTFWSSYLDICRNRYHENGATSEDIYERLIFLLKGHVAEENPSIRSITPSASGVCAYKVLKVYLHYVLGYDAAFQLIFQIEFWTLVSYFRQISGRALTSSEQELLSWSIEKLCRDAYKINVNYESIPLDSKEIFTEDRFSGDFLKVLALKELIDEKLREKPSAPNFPMLDEWLRAAPEKPTFNDKTLEAAMKRGQAKSKVQKVSVKSAIKAPPLLTALNSKGLKLWYNYIRDINHHSSARAFYSFNVLIENLPMPSAVLFKSKSKTLILGVEQKLAELTTLYLKVSNQMVQLDRAGNHAVRIYQNLFHLYALTEQAARVSLKNNYQIDIEQFGIAPPLMTFLFDENQFFKRLKLKHESKTLSDRFLELKAYYERRNRGKSLTLFQYPLTSHRFYFEVDSDSKDSIADFALISIFLSNNPNLRSRLDSKEPSSEAYKLVQLFASKDLLPKEYLILRSLTFLMKDLNLLQPNSEIDWSLKESNFVFENLYRRETTIPVGMLERSSKSEEITNLARRNDLKLFHLEPSIDQKEKTKLLDLFLNYKTPLILKLYRKRISQNDGLCGAAKELIKDKSVSESCMQNLIEIFASYSLKLHNCITSYEENPELLERFPEVPKQFLSEQAVLEQALLQQAGFKEKLEKFFQKNLDFYKKNPSKIETTFHLIELVQIANRQAPQLELIQRLNIRKTIQDLLNELDRLEKKEEKGKEKEKDGKVFVAQNFDAHRAFCHVLFIKSFENSEIQDLEEVAQLFKSWFFLACQKKYPKEELLAQPVITSLESKLVPAFETNASFILSTALGESSPQSEWKGSFPSYNSENVTVDVLEGTLWRGEETLGPLPQKFRDLYCSYIEDKNSLPAFHRTRFKVLREDRKVKIVQKSQIEHVWLKLDNQWHRLIKLAKSMPIPVKSPDDSPFTYRILKNSTERRCWIGMKDQPNLYEVEFHGKGKSFKNFSIKNQEGHYLFNFLPVRNILPELFARLLNFESCAFFRLWTAKQGEQMTVASLELPSYGLSFRNENGHLMAKGVLELEGMRLTNQEEALFKNFKSYLVLEGPGGRKVVLIPNAKFIYLKGLPNDPLNSSYTIDILSLNKETPFIVFNLNKGKLAAKNLEGQILLSLARTISREYSEALSEVKKCWKDTSYTPNEFALLTKFNQTFRNLKSGFFHHQPSLYAVLTYLDWLVLQNNPMKDDFLKDMGAEYLDYIERSYAKYVQNLQVIPVNLKLSTDQELLILEMVISETKNRELKIQLKNRRKALSKKKAEKKTLPYSAPKPFFDKFADSLFKKIPPSIIDSLFEVNPITPKGPIRPNIELPKHFLTLLSGLLSPDNERRSSAFRDLLFMKCDETLFAQSKQRLCALQILVHVSLNYDYFFRVVNGKETREALRLIIRNINENLRALRGVYYSRYPQQPVKAASIQEPSPMASFPLLKTLTYDENSPVLARKQKDCTDILEELKDKCFDTSLMYDIYFERLAHQEMQLPFPLEASEGSRAFQLISNSPYALNLFNTLKLSYETGSKESNEIRILGSKNHTLGNIKNLLEQNIIGFENAILELTSEIERQANYTPLDGDYHISSAELKEVLELKLLKASRQAKNISYADLRYLQMRKDLKKLNELNPFLNQQMIERLGAMQAFTSYFAIEKRHASECLDLVEKLMQEGISESDEAHLLSLLSTQMLFENDESLILNHPHLLAFQEVTRNYRAAQREVIIKCLENNFTHFFFQLIMGAGKTHVILPSLAFMLSDGVDIPIIVVPSFIYPQSKHDLKGALELNNGEHVFEFLYSRQEASKVEALNTLLKILTEVKAVKGCLISTPESIQSLILDLLDYTRILNKENPPDRLEAASIQESLVKIITELQNHGIGIGEEAHVLFQSLKEMNFTVGKSRPIKADQWSLTMEIYRLLANSFTEFMKSALGRSFKSHGPDWQMVKDKLIQDLVDNIFIFNENQLHLRETTIKYLAKIQEDSGFLYEIAAYDPNLAADIARAKEQLNNFLPHSFTKVLQVNYGPKDNLVYAVPYAGSNLPSDNAEFGHTYILQNFTIQMYLELGLSLEQFQGYVSEIHKLWMKEMSIEDAPLSKRVTMCEKIFSETCDFGNLNISNLEEIKVLFNSYRKHPKIVFDFLENWVMPKITLQHKTLNSNAQDIGDLALKKVIAWSGTPYNMITGPEQFAANCKIETQETGDLLRVLALPENQPVYVIEAAETELLFDFLKHFAKENSNFFVLNDLGALFKGIKNCEVARQLLLILPEHIQGVVCFDDDTLKEVMIMRSGEILPFYNDFIPERSRFTYLDQIHAFGTDIQQARDALQLVTHSKETMFFETLQADKRMRQLEFGQRVNHLVIREVADYVKALCGVEGEITANHLMISEFINENNQLEREIIVSSMHKIRHVLRKKIFRTHLLEPAGSWNADHMEDVKKFLSDFFIRKQKDKPVEQFGADEELVKPKYLLSSYFKGLLESFKSEFGADEIRTVQEIIEKAVSRLPKLISSRLFSSMTQEVHKQEEKSLLRETLVSRDGLGGRYKEYYWKPEYACKESTYVPSPISSLHTERTSEMPRIFRLNDWLRSIGMQPIFLNSIFVTENFIKTFQNGQPTFDLPIKSVRYYLTVIGKSRLRTLLLSISEANSINKFMNNLPEKLRSENPVEVSMRDLSGKAIVSSGSIIQAKVQEVENYCQRIRAQLICFSGKEYFPSKLEDELEDWLNPFDAEEVTNNFVTFHQNRHGNNQGFLHGNLYDFLKKRKRVEDKTAIGSATKRRKLVSGEGFAILDTREKIKGD